MTRPEARSRFLPRTWHGLKDFVSKGLLGRRSAAMGMSSEPTGGAKGDGTRKIRLMADFFCFPLWETLEDGGLDNIDPRSLPIPKALAEELLSWSDEYDAILDMDYPPDSKFKSEDEEKQFWVRGRALEERLREELGPSFVVCSRIDV